MAHEGVYTRIMSKKTTLSKKDLPKSARVFGVLLENMDKKIDLVLENRDMLNRKIDGVKDELKGKLDEVRDELKGDIKVLQDDMGVLKLDVTDLKSSAKQILKYLAEVESELQDLSHRMGRKVDQEQIASLQQRVTRLELVLKKYLSGNKNVSTEL